MCFVIKFLLIIISVLFYNDIFVTPKIFDSTKFAVYWNIPSFMCQKYGIYINNLTERYGIIQNYGDSFRGEEYAILYDPGNFPALLKDTKTGEIKRRNGGVPIAGNLSKHLEQLKTHVYELIVDPNNFNGICCIDFESWRPIFRQNFGELSIYKDVMLKIEKNRHPFWPQRRIDNEASSNWEKSGRPYVEDTLRLVKGLLPKAQVGYYAFPYCFNNDGQLQCSSETQNENNRMQYIWDGSDILFPSVYLSESLAVSKRGSLVRGRVREAKRIARRSKSNPQILTYIRYVYVNTRKHLSEQDLVTSLQAMKAEGSNGVVLWGSSNDLNSMAKCVDFRGYLEDVLGPTVQAFSQARFLVNDARF